MAIVKNPLEASKVTLESKWQRYERIKRLFGIRRLGDLFPPNATPNAAANDPLACSGDVLRDLCQIGEALKNKGVSRAERVEMVKKEFKEGEIVQHREIRGLLAKFRTNEFEERLKGMLKKEEEEIGSGEKMEETETKYATSPGLATADQIRADLRRRSDVGPLKRKRDPSIIEIKPEHNSNEQEVAMPKRNKTTKNRLTPHTAHQIAQDTNTAPAKLVSRKLIAEDDTVKHYHDVLALVRNLDTIVGNAQGKLREDVEGADQLLITARNLITTARANHKGDC
jgi:hypothetical protein